MKACKNFSNFQFVFIYVLNTYICIFIHTHKYIYIGTYVYN